MNLPQGDEDPDSSDDERSQVMKFFYSPTKADIPESVSLHHPQQQHHHHHHHHHPQQQQQYQHPFQRMKEEEQRPQLQPRHPQQQEQLQKLTLNPKRERSRSPRAFTGIRLPSTTQLPTRPPLSTLAASSNEALALKTPFDSKLSSKTPKRPKVTFSHDQGRHRDDSTSHVPSSAVCGQFDDADESGDEETLMQGFAIAGRQSSCFSEMKAGNGSADRNTGSLASSELEQEIDEPMPDQDGMDAHYEDGNGDTGANEYGAFDIVGLPVGKLYEDIPVYKSLLLQSVHPTRDGVVLTQSLKASGPSAHGGDGDSLEEFDLLLAIDGRDVYDVTALRSLVSATTVAEWMAESNDEVYVDVLRVKGLHNVVLTGGIRCWVDKMKESTVSVIESMCKYKKVPCDFEDLQVIVSSDFEEDEFEYRSAINTLSSDLSVIHDVSLDGCLHLINGEDGNPAVALMELMTVLHEFCVDPSNCPPVAKEIASYLLLRIVPSSKEDLVLEGMAMMPEIFSGLHALIDALGMAKGEGLQINVLFAHGSDHPVRGGKYPYQPYSPDMKSALCKFSMSCFSYWYDNESSGPLYKLARMMQPGQIAIPWAELDEFDQPVPVSANARGKRGFLNVSMTALSDPGKARAEIVQMFSTDLKSRAYNQNIVHLIHNSAYKACISERFYQSAIREMGLSAYFKFPRTEVETLLDQFEALSQRESSGSGLQSEELMNMLESLTNTASSIMSSLTLESDSSAGQQLDDDDQFGTSNYDESSQSPDSDGEYEPASDETTTVVTSSTVSHVSLSEHYKKTKANHKSCIDEINRILSDHRKSVVPLQPGEMQLALLTFDLNTLAMGKLLEIFAGGKGTFRQFEELMAKSSKLLNPKMILAGHAKARKLSKVGRTTDKAFVSISQDEPICATIKALEKSMAKPKKETDPPIVEAAKKAALEAKGNPNWGQFARSEVRCIVLMALLSYIVVQIRVWYQVTLDDIICKCASDADRKKLRECKDYFARHYKLEMNILGGLDITQVYEQILIKATSSNAPQEARTKAVFMAGVISKLFGGSAFRSEYMAAEAIPLSRTFHCCNAGEIELMKAAVPESFYQNRKNEEQGELTSTSYERCRRSSKLLKHLLFAQEAATKLAPYQPDGEMNEVREVFAVALLCASATEHGKTHLDFVSKLQTDGIDESAAASYFEAGGRVRRLLDGMDATLSACRKEHLFLDITDDINNGTNNTIELMSGCQGPSDGDDGGDSGDDDEHGGVEMFPV